MLVDFKWRISLVWDTFVVWRRSCKAPYLRYIYIVSVASPITSFAPASLLVALRRCLYQPYTNRTVSARSLSMLHAFCLLSVSTTFCIFTSLFIHAHTLCSYECMVFGRQLWPVCVVAQSNRQSSVRRARVRISPIYSL